MIIWGARDRAGILLRILVTLAGIGTLNAATLVWDPNPPEDGVFKYTVYVQSPFGIETSEVTEPRLPLLNLQSGVTYTLMVTATSMFGESAPAIIQYAIPSIPTITSHPQNRLVGIGAPLRLSVTASGTAPLSYQWYLSGIPLPLQTSAALSIPSVTLLNGGTYRVRVSNSQGFVDSDPAVVTVTQLAVPPEILTQPESIVVAEGDPLVLEVAATGTPPLTYQWRKDGAPVPDATSGILSISSAALAGAGMYMVRVTNSEGYVESNPALVTVMQSAVPPRILTQPESVTATDGETVVLQVAATGTPPLAYQWHKDGAAIFGATRAAMTISPVTQADEGMYHVSVSNGAGSVSSASVSVKVSVKEGEGPRIVVPPENSSVDPGASASFEVLAQGQGPLEFQWFKENEPITDGTNSVLEISAVGSEDRGFYWVRVTNPFGTVMSEPVELRFQLRIITQPSSRDVVAGMRFQLAVLAQGEEPLGYQWFKDGIEISGATQAAYGVSFMHESAAGQYQVRVSDGVASLLSEAAVVGLADPPQITDQVTEIVVAEGGELRIAFEAEGSRPFMVHWMRNSALVRTTAVTELVIPEATVSDTGTYVARVVNMVSSAITDPIVVRLPEKPVISAQPRSVAVGIGATVMLSVSASGEGKLSYQWYKDGAPIPFARNIFYSFNVRSEADYGGYSVRLSNANGSTDSEIAYVHPENAGSLLTISRDGTGLKITLRGLPNSTWEIQLCGDLRTGNWATIDTVQSDNEGRFQISVPESSAAYSFIRTVRRE